MQICLQPWPFDFLLSLVNLAFQGLGPLLQSGRGMQLGLYKIYFLKVIPFVQIQIWRIFCYNNSLSLTNLIFFCCRYVDGQDYMESVANAIMKVMDTSQSFEKRRKSNPQAKEEIFITDWWLSPELRLKVISNTQIKHSLLFEPFLESAGEGN